MRCFRQRASTSSLSVDSVSQAEGRDLLRRHGGEGGPDFILICRPADLVDKVLALELGAADVIESPLNVRELAARIGGLLARRGRNAQELIVLENSTVDLRVGDRHAPLAARKNNCRLVRWRCCACFWPARARC